MLFYCSQKANRIEVQRPARAKPPTALEYEIVLAVTFSCSIVRKLIPRDATVAVGFLAQMLLLPAVNSRLSGTGTPVSWKSLRSGGNLVISRSETKPSLAIKSSVSLYGSRAAGLFSRSVLS